MVETKVFKSGNSVALRLPKSLGIKEGTLMSVREEQGRYIVEPVQEERKKIDLTGIWGAIPDIKLRTPEEREFEERELDWTGEKLKRG